MEKEPTSMVWEGLNNRPNWRVTAESRTTPNVFERPRSIEQLDPFFVHNATNHFSFSSTDQKLVQNKPSWLPQPTHSIPTPMCLLATCDCCNQTSTSPTQESLLRSKAFQTYALPPLSSMQRRVITDSPKLSLKSLRKSTTLTSPTIMPTSNLS